MVAGNFYHVIESDDDGDNDFRFKDALIQCVYVGGGWRGAGEVGRGVGGGRGHLCVCAGVSFASK